MSIVNFLVELKELHIFITKNEGKLAVKGDREALTPILKQRMSSYKEEILNIYEKLGISSNYQLAPTTFTQQRLWFLDQLEGSSVHYNIPAAIRFGGKLDFDALNRTYNTIIERHDSLRTYFYSDGNKPYQVIRPFSHVPIKRVDLSHLKNDEQMLAVKKIDSEEVDTAFNLSSDLMIRATLLKLSDHEHLLLYNMHHITSDGWSSGLLANEFIVLFNAYTEGKKNPLPKLAIQYADYAHWQRQWFQGDVLKAQLGYWLKKLNGLPEVHNIPLDFPRPKKQSFQGQSHGSLISKKTSDAFIRLCRRQGTTLFMGLHAVFSLLLSRYSGETDIVIGTPIANREQPDVELLIGFFINSLVLRSDVSIASDFNELLAQSKQTTLEAYEYQQVPFEEIVNQLNIAHSLSYSPVFQVMMVLQNNGVSEGEIEGVNVSSVGRESNVSKFDLMLSAAEREEGIVLGWAYSSDLFESTTIERMANSFTVLLDAIIADSQMPLMELPLMAVSEQQKSLSLLQNSAPNYTQDKCIHELFEEQADAEPKAIALVFDRQEISYDEINRRANQLAHYLRQEYGVTAGTLVGLCIERSPEMVIGLLAILKAGGAYVPLDPDYPASRLTYMLTDAGLDKVICQGYLLDKIPITAAQAVCLDDKTVLQQLAMQLNTNIDCQKIGLSQEDPAYVIYTSGSTGKSKGVVISHHNWEAYHDSLRMPYKLTGSDRVLQFSSMSFDIFIEELTASIFSSGTLVLPPSQEKAPSDREFWQWLKAYQITVVSLPTAFWNYLSADKNLTAHSQLTSLRLVIVGGEVMPTANLQQWQAGISSGITLLNTYGPTETTVVATYADVTDYQVDGNSVTIGYALKNSSLVVLDKSLQLTPVGVLGELHIGGDLLSQGYLNREELTTERFIENPYYQASVSSSSRRLYKTGDLVRYSAQGEIEFVCRNDEQVKIRGFRIELGEIEHRLGGCDGVDSAIVLAKSSGEGGKQLIAYLKLQQIVADPASFLQKIKKSLEQSLPNYMVPIVFIPVDEWPLTPTGKVDKKSLPAVDVVLEETYIAPTTETEKSMVAIWATLLSLNSDRVSVNTSFFDLGGHSLLSIRLVSEIRQELVFELAVKNIFEYSTVRTLAEYIDNAIEQGVEAELRSIVTPVKRDSNEMDVSFAQQRLWFIDKLQEGSAEYNMPTAVEVVSDFNIAAAEQAFAEIIRRHEVLRTQYIEKDAGVVQRISPDFSFAIRVHDLSALSHEQQQFQLQELLDADAQTPFDLQQDLMLRASFVQLDNDNNREQGGVLLFNIHHIASDGWSIGILNREFFTLYQAYNTGQPSALAPLAIQYSDYAHWQRQWLQGEVLDTQLSYWDKHLADIPAVHGLRLDHDRPEVKQHVGARVSSILPADVAQSLLQLAKRYQLTPFMLLHSVLALVLSRHSNSTDIVIGTPFANRLQSELEPLIGFFVNTLVLRLDTSHSELAEYLHHVRQVHLDAQSHQDVPFERLVERLNLPRNNAHTPLFQIMLIANAESFVTDDRGLTKVSKKVATLSSQKTFAAFDLTISIKISKEGVSLDWIYDTSIFENTHISQLSEHFGNLLTAFSGLDETSLRTKPLINNLKLLSDKETSYLLNTLNDTRVEFPLDKCIHELFEIQVANNPDVIAVVFEDNQLTYAELNSKANQLAHFLVEEKHITPDTLVGLCVERSLEMVIGMLAILKAGGAYVPLNPDYPETRLVHMIEDAQLSIVLTQTHLHGKTPVTAKQSIYLDNIELHKKLKQYSTSNLVLSELSLTSSNLAYVIYTSGSTGNPKGVLVEHRSLYHLISAQSQTYIFSCDEVAILFSTFSFDASIEVIWLTFNGGGKLIIPSVECILDQERFMDLVTTNQVTHLDVTPSYLVGLERLKSSNTIRRVISGGEMSLPQNISTWKDRLINVYGPTEATISALVCQNFSQQASKQCIGRPVANTTSYVLLSGNHLAPVGVAGELHIGGVGLARGYLNQPELTAEKFIHNPFYDKSNPDSSRLYKTGDLVRWLPDGNLEFIGRIDHQVKIRGFRIELGEVESALIECDEVNDVVVVAKQSASGDSQLIAYVVVNTSDIILGEEELSRNLRNEVIISLREVVKLILPNYMVPSAFVLLAKLPLTLNGKLNRDALPEPDFQAQIQDQYMVPRNETEKVLAQIWSRLLSLDNEKISIHANFFQSGGHSLLMAKLAQAISEEFDLNDTITIRQLFSSQTISEQAQLLDTPVVRDKELQVIETLGQENSSLPSVYFVPGVVGLANMFKDIVPYAHGNFNIKAFNHRGMIDKKQAFTTIDENAKSFAEQILVNQATGPYVIAGHSYGGVIALEIAKFLMLKGHKVKLVMLDTYFEQALLAVNYVKEVATTEKEERAGITQKLDVFDEALKQDVTLVYQKQSELFETYKATDVGTIKPVIIFANEGYFNVDKYLEKLTDIFSEGVEHQYVQGNHFTMLRGKGAEAIASSITHICLEEF
ncbi:MAG: amino acid adenylation domain-containing protein [Alteromonadaceae bacterium]|jgi:amino acid adenylation domain-containing protein